MHSRLRCFITTCSVFALISCAQPGGLLDSMGNDAIDSDKKLARDDYRNLSKINEDPKYTTDAKLGKVGAPPIPEIAQVLAAPRPPKIGESKLVSIAVTDDVPIKDVLMELARLADVDIEVDAGITGGVAFRVKDKPFNEVIERISGLAGLRYKMDGGILRVERDIPFVKNYSIDFLNMTRSAESTVNVATDVLSVGAGGGGDSGGGGGGGGGGGSGALTTGSTSSISASASSDFWEALQQNIQQILDFTPVSMASNDDGGHVSRSRSSSSSSSSEESSSSGGGSGGGSRSASSGRSGGGSGGGGGGRSGGGSSRGGSGGGSSASAAAGSGSGGGSFVINRQGGVLSISATERQHEMINAYLDTLRRTSSAQVLIEAKICEVTLNSEFQSGVDWSSVIGNSNFKVSYPVSGENTDAIKIYSLDRGDNNLGINLDSVVQLTEQFGVTRTLSSPRLHAINNQQAVLTFAENRVFFEVQVTQQDDQVVNGETQPGTGTVSVETTRRTVPIGIILSMLPSVNLDTSEITLNIRPTLSRVVKEVDDPGSAVANSVILQRNNNAPTFTNKVPIVEVREIDSVMKVKSGQVMVIGGLMEDENSNTDVGVPGVSEVPWLGNAFKSVDKTNRKKELILFIKASIVDSAGSYHNADKAIYKKFMDDPRPLAF